MQHHEAFLRRAIAAAQRAQERGNLPYGCVLVDDQGEVLLEGENSLRTEGGCLGHAEINLIREAGRRYDFDFLHTCTIYTSDEPCPMCAGAIFWSGIGRLVYGLSKKTYYDSFGRDNPDYVFEMPCRELLSRGGRKVEVLGPMLEEEILTLHH